MPERAGRLDALRAAAPLVAGAATLLPIERVLVRSARGASWLWASAAVEPCAVVVRDAGGVRVVAVPAGAEAPSLARLREAIPALDALLAPA